jgi:dUTP pyrophosphatase
LVDSIPIQIHYLPGSPFLEINKKGDWVDLYVYEDITLRENERAYISMGVSMALPEGYEAIMAPRSSTFKRWGILQTNSIGIIDNSYRGTDDIWMMPVLATRPVTIPKGTRLCQFRIQQRQPRITFIPCDSLEKVNRGGLGSSGA